MALEDRGILGGALTPVVVVNPSGLESEVNADLQIGGVDVSATNPIPVTGPFISREVTLTIEAGAHHSGDVLSNTVEVTQAVRTAGGRSLLHSLVLYDLDDQGFGVDIYLLKANVSLGVRNAAPSIGDASVVNVMGMVRVAASDLLDLGGSRVAVMSTVGQMVEAAGGSTSIFLSALVQGAGTYTASGVKVRLHLIPE